MASYEGLRGGEKAAKAINANRSSKGEKAKRLKERKQGLKPTTQQFPF
jgi:hypothetical protein